ncbi:flagellar M-ring protein [Ferrigenium kumadai]|uniref:Flagellar M-ring protein n=1 Tax=Ferrigenium kumadai TaxID=1682490 RepID=A0AAN1VZ06_9PROT|nr:flagellar basal-body MS-ring/collar protein FliF [Ferrigenium kumadai]BBI98779.1 flagellar M-ring protein [Ferrigenium kumadai]
MAEQEKKTASLLDQLTLQQKLGLAVGVAALFALLAGLWMWGKTPDYRVLYSNLSDRDGGAIIDSLTQMNIPYKFAEGGGALLVPSDKVHEARLKLASQGLPKGGNVGFELMENQRFGITQFAEQVNYQRALEGELARSVQSIGAVAAARVHLAIPKPSVFVKEQQKPSASVVLSLQGGRTLDSAQVSAIVHLISSSVPEMSAKDVTVVDQNGTLLSASHDGNLNGGLDANQLKYVQQIEQDYIKRIESLLTPFLGPNNLRAQVAADIDFSRTEQTAEIFKPNQDPAESTIRSKQSSESMNGTGLNATGVPGALTNQPPVPATAPIVAGGPASGVEAANAGVSNMQKDSTVNYEVDRTIRHTVLPVGSIKRLSVAVVVNANRKVTDAKGKTSSKPLTDQEKEQINNLIRDAIGFDQTRGDSLNVQVAAFTESKETVEELPFWERADVIELAKELLKYGLIAAVMFLVIFRIIKPAFQSLLTPSSRTGGFEAVVEGGEGEQAGGGVSYSPTVPSYEQTLQTARQIAQQEPKIVASVIKEWVGE